MATQIYSIIDDSGFLALVDPDAYQAFASDDWSFDLMVRHLEQQMASESILIWGTGMATIWDVAVSLAPTAATGMREAVGPIAVTQGRLLLTAFTSLSMAAQFAEISVPEPHELDQVFALPIGRYRCRVVQRYDPNPFSEETEESEGPDFVIELSTDHTDSLSSWAEIPWLNAKD